MKQLAILLLGLAVLLAACGNQNTTIDMSGMQMNMEAMPTHAHGDDAIAHFSVAMDRYLPGEEATITILIQDKWNKPIDTFDLMHEKLMHLIVVSKDLSYFDHLHPEHVGQGQFTVKTKFLAAAIFS